MRDSIYIKFKYRQNETSGFRNACPGGNIIKKSKRVSPINVV